MYGKFVAFEINIHMYVFMRETQIERDSEKTYCLDSEHKIYNIYKKYNI